MNTTKPRKTTAAKRRRLLLYAVAIGVALLVLNGVVAYRALGDLIQVEQREDASRERITQLLGLLSICQDAETSQRGYMLTGDAKYLVPLQDAQRRAPSALSTFDRSVSTYGREAKAVELRDRVTKYLLELRQSVERRRLEGLSASLKLLNSSKRGMDAIRVATQDLLVLERTALDKRRSQSAAARRTASASTLTSSAVSLILLFGVGFIARRELVSEEAHAAELADANQKLEDRVTDRTKQLLAANSEMKTLLKEREESQRQLQGLVVRLEQSNEALQDFAFVASHDLQEPLRKIRAFGDRLSEDCADQLGERGADYLGRMQSAAARMSRLISDLLQYSRVNTRPPQLEQTDLNVVLDEVLSDLETRIEETGGAVKADELQSFETDPTQMRQILQNLIGNGLKFHQPDVPPVVRVGPVETAADRVSFFVEDNGIGFDEKYLDRIFSPFQRLHGRTEYEGTGIGLAVCRRIVERHGGELTASSELGKGSRFVVALPRKPHVPESGPASESGKED